MGHSRLQVVVKVFKKWLMEYRYKQKINLFQINNCKFRRTWIIKHVWTRVHWFQIYKSRHQIKPSLCLKSESFLAFLRYKTKLLTLDLDPKFHTNGKIDKFYPDASTLKTSKLICLILFIRLRHLCKTSIARYFSRLHLYYDLVVKLSLLR